MDDEKLENFSAYDLIHLLKVERIQAPPKLLIKGDFDTYVLPSSTNNNAKIPLELVRLFEDTNDDILEYDGWVWKRYGKGEHSAYSRDRYVPSDLILTRLNSYLDTLEGLVGKTVKSADILPSFQLFRAGRFFIPETNFLLAFYQNNKPVEMPQTADIKIYAMLGFAPINPLTQKESERGILISPQTTVMRITYEGVNDLQII